MQENQQYPNPNKKWTIINWKCKIIIAKIRWKKAMGWVSETNHFNQLKCIPIKTFCEHDC